MYSLCCLKQMIEYYEALIKACLPSQDHLNWDRIESRPRPRPVQDLRSHDTLTTCQAVGINLKVPYP